MRPTALLLPALLCASVVLQAADPQLLNMVPPDAKVLAGVNVDQARSSPLGQFLLASMPTDPSLLQFIAVSGFDPRRDLHEILVAATAPDKSAAHLFLAKGSFNVERLLSMVPKTQPLTEQLYNGTRIFTHGKEAAGTGMAAMFFAFPDSNTAVAGDLASVQGALDRRGQSSTLDASLIQRIATLSSTLDAWALSALPFSSLSPMGVSPAGPNSKSLMSSELLNKIQQTSGGIKFGDQVHLIGEAVTGDAKDATALGDVIKFLVMMVQNQAPAEAAPAVALIKNLNVVADGTTLRMDLAIAESQIETLIAASKPHSAPKL